MLSLLLALYSTLVAVVRVVRVLDIIVVPAHVIGAFKDLVG